MYKETPLIKQYYNLKLKYPDTILFFQVGEFYEIFGYDAILCSKLLDLTLTKRNKHKNNSIFLVGFPCNSLEIYINKLIKCGYKIAICDQNNNKKSGDLISRNVTNIVSPGISIYEKIEKKKTLTKFVASIYINKLKTNFGISLIDFSTGEFLTTQGSKNYIRYIIHCYKPKEFYIPKSMLFFFKKYLYFKKNAIITLLDDNLFNYNFLSNILFNFLKKNKINFYNLLNYKNCIISSGLLIYYIKKNYSLNLTHIKNIKKIEKNYYLWLDETTIKNLEIIKPTTSNGQSLLNILDKTYTSMGYRKLNNWLMFPLKKIKKINNRLKIIDFFLKNNKNKIKLLIVENLKKIYDIDKLMSKISNKKINPNQLYKLLKTIKNIKNIIKIIKLRKNYKLFNFKKKYISNIKKIYNKIKKILIKNPINKFNKNFYIKKKVNKKLDKYKIILKKKKKKIKKYYNIYIKKKLNLFYLNINKNDNIGYFIEIKKKDIKKIPKDWIIKQKLATYYRYSTPIINKYEYYIFIFKKKIYNLEKKIFNKTINFVNKNIYLLKKTSNLIAKIDVLFSFFLSAKDNNYIKPRFVKNIYNNIKIIEGRHPVIEQNVKKYIPNNIYLDNKNNQVLIITGPNMAGKSAILRQTVLIVLMAQIGSYVPAKFVELNIVDRIFSRIGASDNISVGESTFMVEMNETSYILKNFTKNSLIIMDEIGRGTSTYDGVSLSFSIIKYLIKNKLKPKLLFATHFYEIKKILYNFNKSIKYKYLSIKREKKKILFNRKLKEGLSYNSYGIYIARMSGLPYKIIKDSKKIFNKLNEINNNNICFFFIKFILLLFIIIKSKIKKILNMR
ncbi:MAG: DNA mismatch repair protein MutS [Candidatus Shikimatogenerans bostrichidophilus]|nr:MAG: DNA mismatch repair protein MutS [Candidatus Shikimatogenerans bostrichidophilus]